MTAPLTPGVHTVIVDGWLFRPGQPLFQVPAGTVITEVTPLTFRPDGYVEFRVRVGARTAPSLPLSQWPEPPLDLGNSPC